MKYIHNPELTANAKSLRKNMTAEERRLWYNFLREHRYKFYRQKVIYNYIVDFYCREAQLVIELDGSQHFEPEMQLKDKIRTEQLEDFGLLVLRIPNNEINRNFQAVCEYLDRIIKERINNKGKNNGISRE